MIMIPMYFRLKENQRSHRAICSKSEELKLDEVVMVLLIHTVIV